MQKFSKIETGIKNLIVIKPNVFKTKEASSLKAIIKEIF